MSLHRVHVLTWVLAALLAACGTAAGPTASPTSPPPTATPSLSPEPTPSPTEAATLGPTPIAYPGPAIPPGTLTIEIAAIPHNRFDRARLSAPADTPFVIAFDNRDTCDGPCARDPSISGHAHNVAIRSGDTLIFNPLPTIRGPAKADYYLPEGLSAGTYRFVCILHLAMNGTLTIE